MSRLSRIGPSLAIDVDFWGIGKFALSMLEGAEPYVTSSLGCCLLKVYLLMCSTSSLSSMGDRDAVLVLLSRDVLSETLPSSDVSL